MKLGSLFDGISGFPLAAQRVGIIPVWASEIEPFPIKVSSIRFPNMKQLGDIVKINGAEIEPVDIITFGSPCQDLSVAGKREGLNGKRSGLFRHAIRIIREMRSATNGKYPRFAVWENVPGAFSSNRGYDFKTVLEEITETKIPIPKSGRWANAGMVRGNGYSLAWRVLDAQYWGVPQRRRRIFLVADFGGQSAPEILFEPESVCGYLAESAATREGTARNVEGGVGKTSELTFACSGFSNYLLSDMAATLRSCVAKQSDVDLVVHPQITGTLCASGAGLNSAAGLANETDLVVAYSIAGNTIDRKIENGGNGKGINKEVSFTLNATDRHAVAYRVTGFAKYEEGVGTVRTSGGDCGHSSENLICNSYTVRRLTPLECERLMGFPDGWTDIPGASDTARYKALGNSVAIPCVQFIMERIMELSKN